MSEPLPHEIELVVRLHHAIGKHTCGHCFTHPEIVFDGITPEGQALLLSGARAAIEHSNVKDEMKMAALIERGLRRHEFGPDAPLKAKPSDAVFVRAAKAAIAYFAERPKH